MPVSITENGKLLLTSELRQVEGRFGMSAHRLDDASFGRVKVRFPPIEDVVSALDHIASRESAA
jgi:hypothetical protein